MARQLRQIQHVRFGDDDLEAIVGLMTRLAAAGDGWINVVPRRPDEDQKPTTLGFFTLLGGDRSGQTMCTWIPASNDRGGVVSGSVGITHVAGQRAVPLLDAAGVALPDGWLVQQDHPRRGLVVRVPSDQPPEEVLDWALRALRALSAPQAIRGWQAEIHLPSA